MLVLYGYLGRKGNLAERCFKLSCGGRLVVGISD